MRWLGLSGNGTYVLALPREVGVQVDAVADVHHEQEGRPAVGVGQGASVAEGLVLGSRHGPLPGAAPAAGGAGAACRRVQVQRLGLGRLGRVRALLRLQHEGAPFVEVDPPPLAVLIGPEGDAPLEDVIVLPRVGPGGIRAGHAEQGAQLAQEQVGVGDLGRAGAGPAVDKRVHGGGRSRGGISHGLRQAGTSATRGRHGLPYALEAPIGLLRKILRYVIHHRHDPSGPFGKLSMTAFMGDFRGGHADPVR